MDLEADFVEQPPILRLGSLSCAERGEHEQVHSHGGGLVVCPFREDRLDGSVRKRVLGERITSKLDRMVQERIGHVTHPSSPCRPRRVTQRAAACLTGPPGGTGLGVPGGPSLVRRPAKPVFRPPQTVALRPWRMGSARFVLWPRLRLPRDKRAGPLLSDGAVETAVETSDRRGCSRLALRP